MQTRRDISRTVKIEVKLLLVSADRKLYMSCRLTQQSSGLKWPFLEDNG